VTIVSSTVTLDRALVERALIDELAAALETPS